MHVGAIIINSKEQLRKVKLDVNDLLQDAREDGIFDITGTNGTNAVTYAVAPYSTQ